MGIIKKVTIAALMLCFLQSTAFAVSTYTISIDSSLSNIQFSPFLSIGNPLPETFQISGRFDMTIDESATENNLWFGNVDLMLAPDKHGPFNFPLFRLNYEALNFQGSEDLCLDFSGPGSCLSQGNFGFASGFFDGTSLELNGSAPIDFSESYTYKIFGSVVKATPVPEPSTILLLMGAMAAFVMLHLRGKSRKSNT